MRLPRLHLPRVRLPLDWLGLQGGRTLLLYVGYTATLFVVFLLVTFPHEILIRRALSGVSRGPVDVDFKVARFAWLKGYELSGMRVVSPVADHQPPYVECSRLWIRPSLGALVHGNPYDFLLSAELYGGTALGEISMADGGLMGQVQWHDLDLSRYRTLTFLLEEGQLAGRLSGQFSFEARGPGFAAGQGNGEANVDGASLTAAKIAGFTVPDLHLRRTQLQFTLRRGRLEVRRFKATGDVNVDASGQIVLREPLQNSTLNLRVAIVTSLETPDALKTLVALIPHRRGTKPGTPVTVTGTLARPRVR
ncbi:MAG: type II secretion system protein GspN [Candidatus Binatia bacterium]